MTNAYQLVLLPGLGADARLFEPQRQAFPHLMVPPWISPKKKERLEDYAPRMAETIPQSPGIPLILGGVSFGGMAAYEMSRYLRPKATILISSCHTSRGLHGWIHAGTFVVPWMPVGAWSVAKFFASPAVRIASHFGARDRDLAVTMFKDVDSAFMHWVLSAILRWNPSPLDVDVPIFQLHGRRDLLIPIGRVEPDEVIEDGGHMINVTHAEQVNAYIAKVIAKAIPS
jgi:pimeloyl-ACP methyl ester carboxylesterase